MKNIILFTLLFISTLPLFSQWTQTNGPYSGSIKSLASDNRGIYAGTYFGGLYFSSDSGNTWNKLGSQLNNFSINCIASDGNNLFVGTNEGPYLSTDFGNTWTLVDSGIQNFSISCIKIFGSKIFIGCPGIAGNTGIYLSEDNGTTWTRKTNGMTELRTNVIEIYDSVLYAGTVFGLAVSYDFGDSWQQYYQNINGYSVLSVSDVYSEIYVGTNLGVNKYLSGTNSFLDVMNGQSFYLNNMIFSDNEFYITSSSGIYKSPFPIVNYSQINNGLIELTTSKILKSNNRLIASTNSNGIFVSDDDGQNWTESNFGIINSNSVYLLSNNGNILSSCPNQGVYSSTDNGVTWQRKNNGISSLSTYRLAELDSFIFVSVYTSNTYRSSNNGDNWSILSSSLIKSTPGIKVHDNKIYGVRPDNNIVYSSDYGVTWDSIYAGPAPKNIIDLVFSNDSIFAQTDSGIYMTRFSNNNWIALNNGFTYPYFFSLLKVNNKLFCSTLPYGFYESEDFGNTWTNVISQIPPTDHIYHLFFDGTICFASTAEDGIFVSLDYGTTWQQFNSGLYYSYAHSFVNHNGIIYSGIQNNGIWKTDLSLILKNNSFPEDSHIQSYPNPTNEYFKIILPTEIKGFCKISVTNIQGQIILEKTAIPNQNSEIEIDLSKKADGIYLIKVQEKENIFISKVIKS